MMARTYIDYPQSEIRKEAIIASPGRGAKYRFADLDVGEVFYIYRVEGKVQVGGVHASKRYWEGKLPGRKFNVRTVSVGVRVQRVE